MPENHFDARIATRYDADSVEMFDPAVLGPAVHFLAELAGSGSALELGIGTGRVALPLAQRGVEVHGIDLSADMIDQLMAKPGGRTINVTLGDVATAEVGRTFDLVYVVFNTIMNLTAQDQQVACFRNAAMHLEPGGSFVVEVSVPDLQRLPPGETVRAFDVTPSHLGVDEIDVATQASTSHHYFLRDGTAHVFSVPFRYVWPSELDLMARLAGMTLSERWGDWNREPFTASSRKHISVWRKGSDLA
jgi:SAM-dependent methyltransferase